MQYKTLLMILLLVMPAAYGAAEHKVFGAAPKIEGKGLALSEAVQPANLNKYIRVEAKVTAACQNKGCWMMLTDGARYIRTTFKDYGFFVPKNVAGQTVVMEGTMKETVIKEAEARHFAKDEGKSDEEVAKISGDQKGFAFVAESVLLNTP